MEPVTHERADQPAHHLLALSEVSTGTVLAQRQVGEKENEISAAPPMLEGHWLQGRIISADAMQTQVKFCQLLHRLHADGLLIAKDNQPQLHEDLALYFEDPQADRPTWRTNSATTKGHGRLETRIVTTTADLTSLSSRPLGRHRASLPCRVAHQDPQKRQKPHRDPLRLHDVVAQQGRARARERADSGATSPVKTACMTAAR